MGIYIHHQQSLFVGPKMAVKAYLQLTLLQLRHVSMQILGSWFGPQRAVSSTPIFLSPVVIIRLKSTEILV